MRLNLIKCLKRFGILVAAPVPLLMIQGQAKAILNIRIFDEGPNLKVTVDGSIGSLGSQRTFQNTSCGVDGRLVGEFNTTETPPTPFVVKSRLCTGTNGNMDLYRIAGPTGFGGTGVLGPADSVEGTVFQFIPSSYTGTSSLQSTYGVSNSSFVLGQPFFSSATYNNKSLASEGFTATGLIGTWTIVGTTETINVYIGPEPAPGPLPLLGAGTAFGWSRRLRKRIASHVITSPEA